MPAIESVIEDHVTRFNFPEPARLAPPILAMEDVSTGYEDVTVLHGLSLSIDMDDRIALLGANGNGKSTFAKLLAGRLEPQSGQIRKSGKLRVGYFAQHQEDDLVMSDVRDRPHGPRPAPRRTRPGTQPTRPGSAWTRSGPTRNAPTCRAARRPGCCWPWPPATHRNC